jgi:hypothetical protein
LKVKLSLRGSLLNGTAAKLIEATRLRMVQRFQSIQSVRSGCFHRAVLRKMVVVVLSESETLRLVCGVRQRLSEVENLLMTCVLSVLLPKVGLDGRYGLSPRNIHEEEAEEQVH